MYMKLIFKVFHSLVTPKHVLGFLVNLPRFYVYE